MSAAASALNPWSCVTCRRHKVRCDRRTPCSNCAHSKIDCSYPLSNRPPRRTHSQNENLGLVACAKDGHKQAALLERIKRLEGVVEALHSQGELDPISADRDPSFDGAHPSASDPTARISRRGTYESERAAPKILAYDTRYGDRKSSDVVEEFGGLVIDPKGSGYVSSRFWSEFRDEVSLLDRSYPAGPSFRVALSFAT
jgi:hypothetical protein